MEFESMWHGKRAGRRAALWLLQHLRYWQEEEQPEERKTRREHVTGHTPATCLELTPGVCAQLVLACGLADNP